MGVKIIQWTLLILLALAVSLAPQVIGMGMGPLLYFVGVVMLAYSTGIVRTHAIIQEEITDLTKELIEKDKAS